ncbi:type II toxin-antitoxin system HicA family toxin [Providencia stuartii]|uniref:type II toxin-antitoxin system HicA family toxin n=1 Tax=Providencia TaxID=586 RepID=UPI00111DB657|nr:MULTISPECIES: type II toxin-antitoxin system HicA family toxin [Providencia]ELR5298997.1 type II toxin-antitoxin system HicA family toxin [Providencia stuartii]MDW7587548.1 type II toxin-antitoxin system HicA family toxin [Providencia sp. 2023EL-00965]
MGKKDKLKARLDSLPKDFTWDELVRILGMYGFSVINGNGSRRKFYNASLDRVVSFHEPHPQNIVKGYVVKQVKSLIDEISE